MFYGSFPVTVFLLDKYLLLYKLIPGVEIFFFNDEICEICS